jgi:hypothetical protein
MPARFGLNASLLLSAVSTTPCPGFTTQSVGSRCSSGASAVVRPAGHCWQGLREAFAA